mmetsp:Transcript_51107/g.100436  ORF Transcript_51107/g.100436 Transcript_51107/m.100436 type:complete len:83 (-) Transcript_51107:122-370(-)
MTGRCRRGGNQELVRFLFCDPSRSKFLSLFLALSLPTILMPIRGTNRDAMCNFTFVAQGSLRLSSALKKLSARHSDPSSRLP